MFFIFIRCGSLKYHCSSKFSFFFPDLVLRYLCVLFPNVCVAGSAKNLKVRDPFVCFVYLFDLILFRFVCVRFCFAVAAVDRKGISSWLSWRDKNSNATNSHLNRHQSSGEWQRKTIFIPIKYDQMRGESG